MPMCKTKWWEVEGGLPHKTPQTQLDVSLLGQQKLILKKEIGNFMIIDLLFYIAGCIVTIGLFLKWYFVSMIFLML